jgi:tRNA threonylcarbamoyladenosine modification (KEOPS) complex Cgi121 subunit
MSTTHPEDQQRSRTESEVQRRVRNLEKDVRTLAAAIDAASRLRISTSLSINPALRIAGGRRIRRILERGGLAHGSPETTGPE